MVDCRTGSLEMMIDSRLIDEVVDCRTGSLEIETISNGATDKVDCRTGSLEIHTAIATWRGKVDCRTGSLERNKVAHRLQVVVDCRTGSLEKNTTAIVIPFSVDCRTGSLETPHTPVIVRARFVNTALETWGNVHIIVNNAGYLWDSAIQEMSDEQFDAMIDLHLKAPWQVLRAASKINQTKSEEEEAACGQVIIRKVVNISSLSGTRGAPGQTNYASAKAGIVGLTRALAKKWGPYKVTVNAVAFGYKKRSGRIGTANLSYILCNVKYIVDTTNVELLN
jgi:NAD(P)-dependent dehydrogenase (short-subunit alcohol dehydrogenase family)